MTLCALSRLGWVLLMLCAASPSSSLVYAQQALDVPYVSTPMVVVEAMLNIARVNAQDYVIDLGSGDGRIVITAARKYGARGFGVDLDGALVSQARREAARQGVSERVEFHARNLFITDIDQATVLTSYLATAVNFRLRPRIFSELKPGTRVVSHEFDFGDWKPDAQVNVPVPGKPYGPPSSNVYLWIVPAHAAGRWTWRMPMQGGTIESEVTLEQTFQMLRGTARASGVSARLESAVLRGDEIALRIASSVGGHERIQEFEGRISGDTIRGAVRRVGAAEEIEWQANRVARGKLNIDNAASAPVFTARVEQNRDR
ncbi:MAG: methyltransferase domain-containing protein [Pseudomonadota bacterium]